MSSSPNAFVASIRRTTMKAAAVLLITFGIQLVEVTSVSVCNAKKVFQAKVSTRPSSKSVEEKSVLQVDNIKVISEAKKSKPIVPKKIYEYMRALKDDYLCNAIQKLNLSKKAIEEENGSYSCPPVTQSINLASSSQSCQDIEIARNAQAELLRRHKPLVIKMANRFAKNRGNFEDMFQVACIGLMRASLEYDSNRDAKFTTFAFYFMRKELQLAISKMKGGMRIPYSATIQIQELKHAESTLKNNLGRSPSEEELAAFKGSMSMQRIAILRPYMSPYNAQNIQLGEQLFLPNLLQDRAASNLNEMISSEELQQSLNLLTPREKNVVHLLFGLGNEVQAQSVKDAAITLGISYARVKHLETSALLKMQEYFETKQRSETRL